MKDLLKIESSSRVLKKKKTNAIFQWFKEEPEDLLVCEPADLFSNPPSYKYTVKKTGEMFTSTEKDRKKAYADFLRRDLAETTRSNPKKAFDVAGV